MNNVSIYSLHQKLHDYEMEDYKNDRNEFLTPDPIQLPEPLESTERKVIYRRPTFESEIEVTVDLEDAPGDNE